MGTLSQIGILSGQVPIFIEAFIRARLVEWLIVVV